MIIIEDFIEHYKKEYDFYEMTSKLVAQQLETRLQESGIRAIVTYRAKSPERLSQKLYQRNEKRDTKYGCIEDIYSDICDLSGVRVALYFPSDRDKVENIIKEIFTLISEPKVFPSENKTPNYSKRFSGYWARHYRISLKETALPDSQKRYTQSKTEIQVASVLMHAWSEVEHDLVYKPLNGSLSDEELAILDELNGLVLAGEIALERLQASGNARIAKDKSFNNQYELASFLYNKYEDKLQQGNELQLGNAELLFKLIYKCDLNSPSKLSPYLKSLFFSGDLRSLSEQIADNIILGNEERYEIYASLKSSVLEPDKDLQSSIGYFMEQWIRLEQIISKITSDINPNARILFSPNNLKHFLTGEELHYVLRLRRERNLIVHGIELPSIYEINSMANSVNELCNHLDLKYTL